MELDSEMGQAQEPIISRQNRELAYRKLWDLLLKPREEEYERPITSENLGEVCPTHSSQE